KREQQNKARVRAGERRQEADEERDHFAVRQVAEETLDERGPGGGWQAPAAGGLAIASRGQQGSSAEIDQIGGTSQADGQEERGGSHQDHRQAGARGVRP